MKKGIEVWSDYDKNNRWILCIKKAKGKFTLAEIIEAAREWEWDYYLALVDAFHEPNEADFDNPGDYIELYSATSILKTDI